MLVSDSHKFVFFHFPKTAGSSITAALAPFLKHNFRVPVEWQTPPDVENEFMGWQPNHHLDLLQHNPVRECKYPKEYFAASFVRNPYDLVVSAWHQHHRSLTRQDPNFEQPFTEFVIKEVASRKDLITRWGCQLDYLCDTNGNLLVDWIGRFENLEQDWEKFCWVTKVPHRLLKKRLYTSGKKPYQEHYNERTYQIVTSLFEKDIKYFGYTY